MPWLVEIAVGTLALWLAAAMRERGALAGTRKRFRELAPLHRLLLVCAACLFTLLGGSKGGGGRLASGQAESASADRGGAAARTRTPPEDVATNKSAFAVTDFAVDAGESAVAFELAWATNLFDSVDSRNVDLFMSTNLDIECWLPLARFTMPQDTNAHVFAVTADDVEPAHRSVYADSFGRMAFFRFGLDFDSDGDGLTDAYERLVSFTNPHCADTDGDGLTDSQELSSDVAADPLLYDTDGDGVGDGDEVTAGANPRSADTDGDGLTDAQELGSASALDGEDFMWFDLAAATDLLAGAATKDGGSWVVPLSRGVVVNGVRYTSVRVCVDGTVYLLNPTNAASSDWCNFYDSLCSSRWSGTHLTVAVCAADLYARSSGWGSRILYGSAVFGGRTFDVVEYRDIGLYSMRNAESDGLAAFQLILPHGETNAVYVSCLRASDAFREADVAMGVQCGWMRSWKSEETYYNLPCPASIGFPKGGTTIRYSMGAGTSPTMADTDGDGLSDGDEVLTHRTDPLAADMDDDGLSDAEEVSAGTDPRTPDTDGDGMPDRWEIENGLDPLSADGDDGADGDPDGDGLPNLHECASSTDPLVADTDGDGLSDGVEASWVDRAADVPWFDMADAAVLSPASASVDVALYPSELPFTNRVAAISVTAALADVNGVVYFGNPSTTNGLHSSNGGQDMAGDRRFPCIAVAPYWTDLCLRPALESEMSCKAVEFGGQTWFVLQYSRVGTWSGVTNEVSFQVSMPETSPSNVVYVRYGAVVDGRNDAFRTSVGAQGPNGTMKMPVSYAAPSSTPVADGAALAFHFGCGSSPTMADTDGDDADDALELLHGTDPRSSDTDGDGLSDAWEIAGGINPLSADGDNGADGDPDCDGMTNLQEQALGGNPRSADTDGDGLPDAWEAANGTSLSLADTDGDGLADGRELELGCDPLAFDTDGDGMPDGWETAHGLGPLSADGDDGADGDPDGDGLANVDEYLNNTDPRRADTDGDGISDREEVEHESDPNDPSDEGRAPSQELFRTLTFNVYGDWAAWEMLIEGLGPEDTRARRISMAAPNASESEPMKMRKGNSYRLTMRWLNCGDHDDDEAPWYCWQAQIDGLPNDCTHDSYSATRRGGVAETVAGSGWIAENGDGLLTAHVHENAARGGNVAGDLTATLHVLGGPKLVPDYDRDGKIDEKDEAILDAGKTTFRFWVNDDDDSGNVNDGGRDRPRTGSNGQDGVVNGRCDLLDFTPVLLDVSEVFPPATPESLRERMKWKLASGAVNAVWTSLPQSEAGAFHRRDCGAAFGPELSQNAHEAAVDDLSGGKDLPKGFARRMRDGGDRGVVMVEGRAGGKSLTLAGRLDGAGAATSETVLDIEISSVEEMYRRVSLRGAHNDPDFAAIIPERPPNLMDGSRDLDVFFTHGFNVSEDDARAWGAETFKRLWQSGSNARFWMVAWSGDYNWLGDAFNGLHYQQDVYQALGTGAALKELVERVQPDVSKRILMAHSLGNMVVCEALRQGLAVGKYFMFNAAVASEAIDGTLQDANAAVRAKYVPSDWNDYDPRSWAANWHRWFVNDTTDSRGKIGWPSYFAEAMANAQSVYNYYSTGDEVFAETSGTPWALEGMSVSFANYAWQKQEVLKGSGTLGGTAYGGWHFHDWVVRELEIGVGGFSQYVDKTYRYSASEANAMVANGSITNSPVFNRDASEMFNRDATADSQRLCLAKYVPALSSAIGKTALHGDMIISIDLNASTFRNGWGRNHPSFDDAWLHSDMKDMAYCYLYKLYDDIVKTKGGLQ